MDPVVIDNEVAVEIPPAAAFYGYCKLHEIYASSGNPNVKSAALVEGDGGVGSVIRYDFVDAGIVKEQVLFLDKEAFEVTTKVTEGFGVGTIFEYRIYKVKVIPSGTGSILKVHAEFLPLPGAADLKKDDLLDAGRARTLQMSKSIEAAIKTAPPLTFDEEVAVDGVPPVKFFDGLVKRHEIVQKLAPERYNSVALIQGDGGVGSITQVDLVGQGTVKERTELVDKDTLEAKFSLIEGPSIGTQLASITYHFKVSPAPGGAGSICKAHVEYIRLPGANFKEEDLDLRKRQTVSMVNAIGSYLTAHA